MIKSTVQNLQFDIRKISEKASQKKDCIRADIGEPNFSPSQEFSDILQKIIPTEKFEYAPTFGQHELLQSIEKFEGKKYEFFSNPQCCVTTGGQAGLFSICASVLENEDEVIVDTAYYPPYKSIITLCGGKIRSVDFEDIDLEKNISKKTKIIILNSPNNPTGKVYAKKILEKIAHIAQKNNILIISDDVYDCLLFSETTEKNIHHIAEFAPQNTVIVNSVSKSLCLTGARIGWIIGEKKYITEIAKVHRNINSCPNTTFQNAVAQFLQTESVLNFLQTFRTELEVRAKKLMHIFSEMQWKYTEPAGGMYLWVKIPDEIMQKFSSDEDFIYYLIDTIGVSGVPGSMFGKASSGHIRFCFGALSLNDIELFCARIQKLQN